MSDKSRAYTKEECVNMLLEQFKEIRDYWLRKDINRDIKGRMDGMLFSILTMFDGETSELPALNISLFPTPEDKQYYIDQGENYFEPNQIINDEVELHSMWCKIRG